MSSPVQTISTSIILKINIEQTDLLIIENESYEDINSMLIKTLNTELDTKYKLKKTGQCIDFGKEEDTLNRCFNSVL